MGICLPGDLGNAGDILAGAAGEEGCYRYPAGGARDAAGHPATQGTALRPPRAQNKEFSRWKCHSTYVARPPGEGRGWGEARSSRGVPTSHRSCGTGRERIARSSVGCPRPPPLPKCIPGAGDLGVAPEGGALGKHYLHQDQQPGPALPR